MNIIYGINSKHLAIIGAVGIGIGFNPCVSHAESLSGDTAKIETCKADVRADLVKKQKECFKEAAKDAGAHVDCFPSKTDIDKKLKECESE